MVLEKLNGIITTVVLFMLVCGALGACEHSKQVALDEKRELFQREGRTAPCEVVDANQTVSRDVTKTRSGRVLVEGRPYVSSTSVTCEFRVDGVPHTDTFEVPYDLIQAMAMSRQHSDLARDVSQVMGRSSISDQVLEHNAQYRESLMTVTYLPSNPRRAVLGPLKGKFPPAQGTSFFFQLTGLSVLALLILGAVRVMLNPPKAYPEEA
jgi:hypothetical protein